MTSKNLNYNLELLRKKIHPLPKVSNTHDYFLVIGELIVPVKQFNYIPYYILDFPICQTVWHFLLTEFFKS